MSKMSMVVDFINASPEPVTMAEVEAGTGVDMRYVQKIASDLKRCNRIPPGKLITRVGRKKATQTQPEHSTPTQPAISLMDLFVGRDQVAMLEACKTLKKSPEEIEFEIGDIKAREGIEIAEIDDNLIIGVVRRDKPNPLADRKIKFGVASDIHIGSKSTQITALTQFVRDCIKAGVTHILVSGDVTDGTGIFPGQELHQYAQTAESQLYSAVKNLPRGVQWIVLGGNHDYSWMSKARGYNILARLETEREDVTFIGFDRAIVPLLPGVDAMLWHGRGGGAYAKSYKLQNHVRNIAFDELRKFLNDEIPPSIRFLFGGHWHVFAEVEDGGIECFLCGAFSGRTNLTDQMGVSCIIRGLIVETEIDCRGRIKRLRCDKLTYPEITDDWKNYDHEPQTRKILQPVFGG